MEELLSAAKNLLNQQTLFYERNPGVDVSQVEDANDSEYVDAWDKLRRVVENMEAGDQEALHEDQMVFGNILKNMGLEVKVIG